MYLESMMLLSAAVSYVGETLWIGELGHFLVVLFFVGFATSAFAYYRYVKDNDSGWRRIGDSSLLLSSLSVMAVAGMFFYILSHHFFEYYYVYANTSEDLLTKYVFSAFWKDQEGSVLLWIFWNTIIGLVVWWRGGELRYGVLAFLGLFQTLMASMLLGVIVIDGDEPLRLGLDPFRLLRDEFDAPIFGMPNYLEMVQGAGLNPALQNYWMTIHPPTVFLGFALCSVPIAYAVSGFWNRDRSNWIKPAYLWALFGAGVLGTGILMGSVWAYEALNFGGYWAWDPVENMSLVPWLLLVGGLHTNLISIRTGRSYVYTYVFYALTMVTVLYSSYLTKSGVLGDTSVHSFTAMGLGAQLILIVLVFGCLFVFLGIKNWKKLPEVAGEEKFWSREFWVFLGSLVFILSAVLISFITSIPVYNKLVDVAADLFNRDWTNLHRTIPLDAEAHHNRYQLWIAVLLAFVSGIALFLRWKESNVLARLRSLGVRFFIWAVLASVATFLINLWMQLVAWQYFVLLWSTLFSLFLVVDFTLLFERRNWRKFATGCSHLGFGLMLLGIMFSGIKKRHVSKNLFVFQEMMADRDKEEKNVFLIKDAPLFIDDGFMVTYTGDSLIRNQRHYSIDFERKDSTKNHVERFTTTPAVIYNNEYTKVASVIPSTKRYWHKDIFTHLAGLPPAHQDVELARELEDSLAYQLFNLRYGDTLYCIGYSGAVGELRSYSGIANMDLAPSDRIFGVDIEFFSDRSDHSYTGTAYLILQQDGLLVNLPHRDNVSGIKFKLDESIANSIFAHEDSLEYEYYEVRLGERFRHGGNSYLLDSIYGSSVREYKDLQDDDVAITAVIRTEEGDDEFRPTFVIRDSRQIIPIRDYQLSSMTSVKMVRIDPSTESYTVGIAKNEGRQRTSIPILLAEGVPRDDYVVLEAIVFPGINFFWLGTVLMMLGFFVALFLRRREWGRH